MVTFGGHQLPMKYANHSVLESHQWTRSKASLFDVGHMVQHNLSGPKAGEFLEKISPLSSSELQRNCSSLSCLLRKNTGGIVDDTVVTRLAPESFYFVTNAACKEKVTEFVRESIRDLDMSSGLDWQVKEKWGLIALQGPLSEEILGEFLQFAGSSRQIKDLYFGESMNSELPSLGLSAEQFHISRGGYTGEDGFEISIHPEHTQKVATQLLGIGRPDRLRLAGLAARDSLRLEAGMCLYGQDLDESITPVEAGLGWIISKHRRIHGGFNGDSVILQQLAKRQDGGGPPKKRVGMIIKGAPARNGAEIFAEDRVVGKVTSGVPSPSLGSNIAMGYVESRYAAKDTSLQVCVRGKMRPATLVRMPFVESKYKRRI